jgi:nitronate monooxygenase
MPRRTPVTELLGIEHPILLAPMASAGTPAMAAAVSEAGGLGALGSAVLPVDELRRQAAAVRAATGRPFQLNFFCHERPAFESRMAAEARERLAPLYEELGLGAPPEPSVPPHHFDEERLEALLEIRPPVASFHFGLPPEAALAAIREAGIKLLATATSVEEARELEAGGVDAVVAQGAEAGGHQGNFEKTAQGAPVGTLALVPQIVDAVELPVIAAGGIGDGRGLAAALALGAGGAQLGTAFLLCPESAIPAAYREALRAARATDTVLTRSASGRPARMLRNRLPAEVEALLPYPAQRSLVAPLSEADLRAFLPMFSGQAMTLAREVPAAELVAAIAAECDRALASA